MAQKPEVADGVAFVMQGGGSWTAPQVGMLRALTEAGIVPERVVGSSAGALNAVAYAASPDLSGVQRLTDLWLSLRRKHVARLSLRTLAAGVTGRGDGLVSSRALRSVIENNASVPARLEQTVLPVHVVATDLMSGEPVVFTEGPTVPALLASCAFPGLYPPVRIGSRHLVDGGVSADVPILQAEAIGARTTYVLPAAVEEHRRSRPRGSWPVAYHALGMVLESVTRRDAAAARGTVHILPAPKSQAVSPIDFRDTSMLIEQGYELTRRWLGRRLEPSMIRIPPPSGTAMDVAVADARPVPQV